jgi:hypothetical protein
MYKRQEKEKYNLKTMTLDLNNRHQEENEETNSFQHQQKIKHERE